ncbi:MAG: SCO family protein [Verrucomicrobia bacterium]|nr:MAG: SCO family protein [Verrucomicrobiota bacterium]
MKAFRLPLVATAALLATLVTMQAGYCSTNSTPSCCARTVAPEQFSDKSLYQTESTWTTDAGKQIKLGALAGKPQVVVMFFASCQFTCPVTVHDLQRIEAALPAAVREQVGFTLVSFDSKRDTSAALAKYREARQLSSKNWTLMRGEPDDVLELSALLGVNFKQDAQGNFAHSNVITILNAQGEVVHRLIGLNQDVNETVRVLEQLAAK